MESSNLRREKGKQDNSNGVTYSDSSSLSARVITDNPWQLSKLSNSFLTFHYKVALELQSGAVEAAGSCQTSEQSTSKRVSISFLKRAAYRFSRLISCLDLIWDLTWNDPKFKQFASSGCLFICSFQISAAFQGSKFNLVKSGFGVFKEFVGFYCFPSHCFLSSD